MTTPVIDFDVVAYKYAYRRIRGDHAGVDIAWRMIPVIERIRTAIAGESPRDAIGIVHDAMCPNTSWTCATSGDRLEVARHQRMYRPQALAIVQALTEAGAA